MKCKFTLYNLNLDEYPKIISSELKYYLTNLDKYSITHFINVIRKIMVLNNWKHHEKIVIKCCCKIFLYHNELLSSVVSDKINYLKNINEDFSCKHVNCFICD